MFLGLDLLVKLDPEARLSKAVPLHFGTSFFPLFFCFPRTVDKLNFSGVCRHMCKI
jgi:hypothetical protein